MPEDVVVVLCTCPTGDTAETISRTLVEEGRAACVNIVASVQSIYRWNDHIQHENESLLIIKSSDAKYTELQQRLEVLHPYDVPEILALPVSDGLPAYLEWVTKEEK